MAEYNREPFTQIYILEARMTAWLRKVQTLNLSGFCKEMVHYALMYYH